MIKGHKMTPTLNNLIKVIESDPSFRAECEIMMKTDGLGDVSDREIACYMIGVQFGSRMGRREIMEN